MLRFLNGILLGTTSSAGNTDAGGGGGGTGGGTGGAGGGNAFLATLPEAVRSFDGFKDVKDTGDLATRFHKELTRPLAERLPEKIRSEPYFKDIKSIDDLAEKAFNQAKMIGRDPNTLFSIPAKDDKEGLGKIYNALGRPETADKYAIPKRADGKDYGPEDAAFQKAILPKLHEIGMTQAQVEQLVPVWNEINASATTAQTAKWDADAAKSNEALRGEWGSAYDQRMQDAAAALEHYFPKEIVDELNKASRDGSTVLGDNQFLARGLAKIGAQLREDGLIGKGEGGGQGSLAPDEAKQQIRAKMADAEFLKPYRDKSHAGHADAVAEMERLFKQAYPGEQQAGT